ncbi:MAG: TetR/AcrR family transcriptional regulator [Acidimicrobiia bacterium]
MGTGPEGAVTDRRAARHEATKQRILDAAWELAREQGLAGISLRDLAARVDLRQPSLYSYFDSKLALYDAMFAQGYEQLLAEVETLELSGDPRQQIRQMAHVFTAISVADVVRAQLLFQRTLPGFEPSAESYALASRFLDEGRRRLEAAGFTRPEDLDLYTALVGGLVNQQMANDPGGTRWIELVDEAVDMYLEHAMKKGGIKP